MSNKNMSVEAQGAANAVEKKPNVEVKMYLTPAERENKEQQTHMILLDGIEREELMNVLRQAIIQADYIKDDELRTKIQTYRENLLVKIQTESHRLKAIEGVVRDYIL